MIEVVNPSRIIHDNTIIFGAKNASIVALTMMSDDAVNITGTHPSSYSKGDVFVISGLINPTLVVQRCHRSIYGYKSRRGHVSQSGDILCQALHGDDVLYEWNDGVKLEG